tara:strand:- start:4964 stop:5191 length:228 start_codon:yes stop_codon:yes gene_type:complete
MRTPLKKIFINDLEIRVYSLSEALGSPVAESVTIIDHFNDVSYEEAELIFDYLIHEGFIESQNAKLEIAKNSYFN